jgi:hypothetical protein
LNTYSCMLGKYSTSKLYSQPISTFNTHFCIMQNLLLE